MTQNNEEDQQPIVLPGPADDSAADNRAAESAIEATEGNAPTAANEEVTAGAPEGEATDSTAATPAPAANDVAPQAAAHEVSNLPFVERVPLIAGNWKMNLDHLQAIAHVQKIAWALKDARHDFASVEVAVFPPFTDLRSVQTLLSADRLALALGAQDVSPEAPGAFTGDIAASFLAKLETKYVLVGHSERRQGHGESDAIVGAKAAAVAAAGMTPLICVGETAEDLEAQGAAAVPLAQLEAALSALPRDAEFAVAYEPVWAIGSGEAASREQAEAVCRELRLRIAKLRGEETAVGTRILYGGSVTSQNIASFMREPDIDGALVGGASLNADEFTRIVRFRNHVTAG